jgi:H+-transporting ATPase
VLLRYVADQQEKLKNKKDDDGEDDDDETQYKRVWYAPWKKVKVDSKAKKVRSCPLSKAAAEGRCRGSGSRRIRRKASRVLRPRTAGSK